MELQPFDNQELPRTTIELKIAAQFFKNKGQAAGMDVQIFYDENRRTDPATYGVMLLGAMFHWCQQVTPEPGKEPFDKLAAERAKIMQPHLEKIMDEMKLINPERSLNKLFNGDDHQGSQNVAGI